MNLLGVKMFLKFIFTVWMKFSVKPIIFFNNIKNSRLDFWRFTYLILLISLIIGIRHNRLTMPI